MVEMTDELIENVMYLIDSKKGDIGRLNYILSALQDGKSLYNSDKKYLDSVLSTYMKRSEQKSLEILHGKSSTEYRGSNHYKSEGTALVLSLLFGLLGFMGLGHRYVGHVAKSLAILYLGWTLLFLNFLTGFFMMIYPMIFPQSSYNNPFLLSLPLTTVLTNRLNLNYSESSILMYTMFIVVSVGYFALYMWQIFDSRNVTRRFNRIMDQTGEQLYKMTLAKKITFTLIALGPIYAVILIALSTTIEEEINNLEVGLNSMIHTNPFIIQLEMKLDSLIGIKH
jgi:hypothetical protein